METGMAATGPFGATPSMSVIAGDLGVVSESFGGLFEMLDALNSEAEEADRAERRAGGRRVVTTLEESAGRLIPERPRLAMYSPEEAEEMLAMAFAA